jgi:hypothetical protein
MEASAFPTGNCGSALAVASVLVDVRPRVAAIHRDVVVRARAASSQMRICGQWETVERASAAREF